MLSDLILEDHGQEVVDAAAPHAPVVTAGEGTADHVHALGAEQFIVSREGLIELILGTHRPIEHLEALVEFMKKFAAENPKA